jgi:hypothetical protein
MDFSMGEIGQATAVVKVHVGEDDVFYFLRFISKSLDLIDCRFLRVKWHEGNDAKELCKPCRVGVIFKAETCIYEHKSLIRFDKQADKSRFPVIEAGIAREAVEDADGHGPNMG